MVMLRSYWSQSSKNSNGKQKIHTQVLSIYHVGKRWGLKRGWGFFRTLWNLINTVKARIAGVLCCMRVTGQFELFQVLSGVKYVCVMPGFVILIVIDWGMRRTLKNTRNGIRWKLTTTLDDFDFADNLALSSDINEEKTKVLRYKPVRVDLD